MNQQHQRSRTEQLAKIHIDAVEKSISLLMTSRNKLKQISATLNRVMPAYGPPIDNLITQHEMTIIHFVSLLEELNIVTSSHKRRHSGFYQTKYNFQIGKD